MTARLSLVLAVVLLLGALPSRAATDVFTLPAFVEATRGMDVDERLEAAAVVYALAGRDADARPILEVLAQAHPDRAGLWILLAVVYNRLDAPLEAYDAAGIAMTLLPERADFQLERGIAAFRLRRDEEAIAALGAAAAALPHNATARYYLGLAALRTGEPGAAADHLRAARELNPNLALLTDYYLGVIAAGRGDADEARALLTETRAALPEDSRLAALVERQLAALADSLTPAAGGELRRALLEADARRAPPPRAAD